ncbi:MAG: M3 family metallopeptidase [Planctomycetota bacterium]|nr:M3 family metallopeptidase [Planctomycetota bacterium]
MTDTSTAEFVHDLNHAYERIHRAKEDAFWTAYMGTADDPDAARSELARREVELQAFLSDPLRLSSVRSAIARAEAALDEPPESPRPHEDDVQALAGWLATFEAHVIDSAPARALQAEIVALEAALAGERARLELRVRDESGVSRPASSVKLGVLLASDRDESVRRSAWDALRGIETHVVAHGFLEVVRKRNELGRMLGAEDYYDWKVRRVEGLTKAQVFEHLDDLERRTRDSALRALEGLVAAKGLDAKRPWNLRYAVGGDVTTAQDPYFPFAKALERYGRSFAALGIDYRGATLVLDLVDRPGKYENGFMHGPVPAWRERGAWRPARIQFTANAIPGMVGAGRRALETLFHEGGHAAHFANVDMPSPCFSQEFAPTSVAFSELQSMFLDSFVSDPDWQQRYARDIDGAPIPAELVERGIRASQPFAAWNLRAMVAVCVAERAIYEIPDAELSADRVLAAIRDAERRLLFLEEGSPRPSLSVPHLLAGESSAYYHGYVLAEIAVQQTRAFFRARDGHLVDNPRIGPDLREHYWRPGNSLTFLDFVENLTGEPLSSAAIAARVNRGTDEALSEMRADLAREPSIPRHAGLVELNARIRVVHGREEIADSSRGGYAGLCSDFERWIGRETAITPRR